MGQDHKKTLILATTNPAALIPNLSAADFAAIAALVTVDVNEVFNTVAAQTAMCEAFISKFRVEDGVLNIADGCDPTTGQGTFTPCPVRFPLSTDAPAGSAHNLRVTTSDGSDYMVDWNDGTIDTVPSGALATHTYAAPFNGTADIVLPVGVDVARVISSQGHWDFDVSAVGVVQDIVSLTGNDMAVTGDVAELSGVSDTVTLLGANMAVSGDVAALANVANTVTLTGNSMTVTGDVGALANVALNIVLNGNSMTVFGDVGALANVRDRVALTGANMTVSGNGSALANVSNTVTLNGNNMTVQVDIAALSGVEGTVFIVGDNIQASVSATFAPPTTMSQYAVRSLSMTPQDVDRLLESVQGVTNWVGTSRVDIRPPSPPPTSAGLAVVPAIENNGAAVLL